MTPLTLSCAQPRSLVAVVHTVLVYGNQLLMSVFVALFWKTLSRALGHLVQMVDVSLRQE
jgi:hypothetical protein